MPNLQSKFDFKMRELEEKLVSLTKNEDSTLKNISENLQKLSQILKNQKATREIIEERKNKEVRAAESTINLEVY